MLRRPVEPAAQSGHFNSARECSLSGNSGHVHEGHVCLASASDFQKPKIDETIMSLFRFRNSANEGRLALPLHGDGHGVVDMKTALPVTFIALGIIFASSAIAQDVQAIRSGMSGKTQGIQEGVGSCTSEALKGEVATVDETSRKISIIKLSGTVGSSNPPTPTRKVPTRLQTFLK